MRNKIFGSWTLFLVVICEKAFTFNVGWGANLGKHCRVNQGNSAATILWAWGLAAWLRGGKGLLDLPNAILLPPQAQRISHYHWRNETMLF
jgi:hypothetical protein